VLGPGQLLGEYVVPFAAFKGQAESVSVEGAGRPGIAHDRGHARYELDLHGLTSGNRASGQLQS
jgi:hypothetical protein